MVGNGPTAPVFELYAHERTGDISVPPRRGFVRPCRAGAAVAAFDVGQAVADLQRRVCGFRPVRCPCAVQKLRDAERRGVRILRVVVPPRLAGPQLVQGGPFGADPAVACSRPLALLRLAEVPMPELTGVCASAIAEPTGPVPAPSSTSCGSAPGAVGARPARMSRSDWVTLAPCTADQTNTSPAPATASTSGDGAATGVTSARSGAGIPAGRGARRRSGRGSAPACRWGPDN